jgi:hypothetical protein
MTYLSSKFRNAVLRLSDAPQRALSRVSGRLRPRIESGTISSPPPAHVTVRLETVFEALSELAFQPHVAAALELACDALEAELPTESLAAGLYDIDADEIRFVAARGLGADLLRGTALQRSRCVGGFVGSSGIITSGADGAAWIGSGDRESTVLLCPIHHDAALLGLIALADPLCAAEFNRHDLDLVRYVSAQLADFIHMHRLIPSERPAAG